MPLLLLLSIVGINLYYRHLAEKQGFFCSEGDNQLLGLIGVFAGDTQLWFWIWAQKSSARAFLGYMPFHFCGPIFIADNRYNNKFILC